MGSHTPARLGARGVLEAGEVEGELLDQGRSANTTRGLHSGSAWLPMQVEPGTGEEVEGKVAEVAQDQNGCRFLQKKFDEGGPAAISMVFAVS